MRKWIGKSFALSFLALVFLSAACDETDDIFDDGPSNEPNFTAEGIGENTAIDMFIEILASRDDREVSGDGTVIIDGEEFDIDVIGGFLPTDFDGEPPIPQTNSLSPIDIVCTPRFAELEVRLNPGNFITTLTMNECEKDNSDIFVDNGVVFNPCNDDEPVDDIQAFNGVCLEDPDLGVEFGRDTMVLGEFDGMCGPESPCIVPRDVLIFVPAFNDDLDFDELEDDIDDIEDEIDEAF
ncbi:MAG: hypothetical protein RIG61_11845 [Deltaproteobacteria bacterium]